VQHRLTEGCLKSYTFIHIKARSVCQTNEVFQGARAIVTRWTAGSSAAKSPRAKTLKTFTKIAVAGLGHERHAILAAAWCSTDYPISAVGRPIRPVFPQVPPTSHFKIHGSGARYFAQGRVISPAEHRSS